MKFLHISDLHIGKRVNEFSMIEDQKFILEEITNITETENINSVILAGDVYDKSTPTAEAVQVFDDFLTKLAQRNLKVFIISGNHDSAERMAFGCDIMKNQGIYISPVYKGKIEKIQLINDNNKNIFAISQNVQRSI